MIQWKSWSLLLVVCTGRAGYNFVGEIEWWFCVHSDQKSLWNWPWPGHLQCLSLFSIFFKFQMVYNDNLKTDSIQHITSVYRAICRTYYLVDSQAIHIHFLIPLFSSCYLTSVSCSHRFDLPSLEAYSSSEVHSSVACQLLSKNYTNDISMSWIVLNFKVVLKKNKYMLIKLGMAKKQLEYLPHKTRGGFKLTTIDTRFCPSGVNLINIKRTNFSYERCIGSFYYVHTCN